MTDLDAIAKRAAEAKARAEMAMARPWAFNLTADVHDLAADVETLLGRVRDQDDEIAGRIHVQMELEAGIARVTARVATLREALQYYAEPQNWKDEVECWGLGQGQSKVYPAPAKLDAGERARLVLLLPPDEAAERLLKRLEASEAVLNLMENEDAADINPALEAWRRARGGTK